MFHEMRLMVAFCGLFTVAASSPLAHGQQPRRYQPAMPTVSPYLNLTRPNFGGLPNYYSLVRPQLQQQAFNQQQQAIQSQQRAVVERLRGDFQQTVTPTGKGAGFMTFSPTGPGYLKSEPYYQLVPSVRRR